jgi:hypothetical protein
LRTDDEHVDPGHSRRVLIKRSAMVDGTVAWVAPAIKRLTPAPPSTEPVDVPQPSVELRF